MGIPVDTELFTEADFPGACNLLLFDGRTPKYIELHVSGIQLCPGSTTPEQNGTYVLTQFDSRLWRFSDDDRTIELALDSLFTALIIVGHPGFQRVFIANVDPCLDTIPNGQANCAGDNEGFDGQATLFWGPGISP